ncbi:hypothetical protein BH23CHL7_BH23CHL7_05680 [soil metagenome]
MVVFVDTSALIALLDEDDHRHAQAAREFRWLVNNAGLVTHNYVQLETLALARRRLGGQAVERLTDLLLPVIETIWIDPATHSAALAVHRSGGPASLVDQVSFLVMRQQGIITAWAFDSDFEHEGFARPLVPADHAPPQISEEAPTYGSDLVSVAEISARAGRPVNTIQSWRRRHGDFPAPVVQLAAGPVWNWPVVESWIAGRDRRLVAAG